MALDLLFPPHCAGCGRVGSFLCPHCISSLAEGPTRRVSLLDGVVVLGVYEGALRKAIHALKYQGIWRLADPLGELLSERIVGAIGDVDWVCAVPLHEKRQTERGYNQSALVAEAMAARCGWNYGDALLVRIRETQSQVNLGAQERRENVAGAFRAADHLVTGQRILIVDDVLTTGATIGACAQALRRAGAQQVWGAVLASADMGSDADAGLLDALA